MNKVLVGDSVALELPGEAGAGELVCGFVRDLLIGEDEEGRGGEDRSTIVAELRDAVESVLEDGETGRLGAVLEITSAGVEVTLSVDDRRACAPILVPVPTAS